MKNIGNKSLILFFGDPSKIVQYLKVGQYSKVEKHIPIIQNSILSQKDLKKNDKINTFVIGPDFILFTYYRVVTDDRHLPIDLHLPY